MKKLTSVLVLIGLVVAATARVQAQGLIPLSANFKLTVQAQGLDDEQVGTSPIFKSTIVKMKVTTKDIIALLGVAYATTFSNNVSLVIDDSTGDFLLVNGTNIVHNVSTDGFMSNFYDLESDELFTGQFNDATGAEAFTDVFTNEIHFRDDPHNNRFVFVGLESFKFSQTAEGKFKDTYVINGQGSGELETPPGGGDPVPLIMLSGSVSGSATGVN